MGGMMWAIPSVLFLAITLPMVALLWFAVLYEAKEAKRGDAEWERCRRRLEALNRPVFPPYKARFNESNMLYAATAYSSLPAMYPGAVWHVTHG